MAPQDNGISAYESLGSDLNKQKGGLNADTKVGIVSEKLPELTLTMPDADLVKLLDTYEKVWKESPAKQDWEKQIEENEKYWLGKHFDTPTADKNRAMVDNLIFESLETYLPLMTRRNPEPLVTLDSSELDSSGNETPVQTKYVAKVKAKLADLADKNKLRLKLKKGARHWAIYQLGVAKFGWDLNKDLPSVRVIRPKKIILDPEATIDEDGYTGNRVGEYRKMTASRILAIIGTQDDVTDETTGEIKTKGNGEAVTKIKEKVKDELETEIQFIEWWTPEYLCWKLDSTILFKKKNPHWNYDTTPVQGSVDDYGNETPAVGEIKGINHLPAPEMPYKFISIFNLGDQPMDKTSLIGQNLSNQDSINKRNKQIDKNVDRMNGGMVVSLARSGLTQPQAKGVSEALRKGGVVVIPDGSPREAIDTYSPPALPSDVFGDLNDKRVRMRDIFGTRGSSAAGLSTEDTVRGKILNVGTDTDRAGGLSEYLEQWSDDIYNWFVQLLYVYDPAFQFVEGAVPPKIIVSVKEGSLLPKDSSSIANQALELAKINRISNLDLYKRLEWPNPEELAANVWLEVNAPQLLFKDNPLVQEAMAMAAQANAEKSAIDAEQKGAEHEKAIEMERMKGDQKMDSEVTRSMLKAVPVTN